MAKVVKKKSTAKPMAKPSVKTTAKPGAKAFKKPAPKSAKPAPKKAVASKPSAKKKVEKATPKSVALKPEIKKKPELKAAVPAKTPAKAPSKDLKAASSPAKGPAKKLEKKQTAAPIQEKLAKKEDPKLVKKGKAKKEKEKEKDESDLDDDFIADDDMMGDEIGEYEEELKEVEEADEEVEIIEEWTGEEKPKGSEEIILTDAEGRRYCRARDCDQIAVVEAYCRYHYLLFWKRIQVRKRILADGKLERYVEELTSRYPDKFLEMIRRDLRTEKDFLGAIQELEIDESAGENEFEEDTNAYIEEVRGMEGTSSGVEDDEY